jgi:hypothetical protein
VTQWDIPDADLCVGGCGKRLTYYDHIASYIEKAHIASKQYGPPTFVASTIETLSMLRPFTVNDVIIDDQSPIDLTIGGTSIDSSTTFSTDDEDNDNDDDGTTV